MVRFLILSSIILLFATIAQAQNLVQSFLEQNNYTSTEFGKSVSSAGDVNKDGYEDFVVGAPSYNDGFYHDRGRIFIFFGGKSIDHEADIVITGTNLNGSFGSSVSGAGDVNNDGFDDIIVGDNNLNNANGYVYLFLGGNTMDDVPDVTIKGPNRSKANGIYIQDGFGLTINSIGDINNDTYYDIIVGAGEYNTRTGRASIYLGGKKMNNVADYVFNGSHTWCGLGTSVSLAGDVNNDGFNDLIMGAPYEENKANGYGSAYIFYGGTTIDTNPDIVLYTGDMFGKFGYNVSMAGDVNNDGFDDVIIGASETSTQAGSYMGKAYIYLGASQMKNIPDVELTGESDFNFFGTCIKNVGDINNDGYDDVAVGALGLRSLGAVELFYGGSQMDNVADLKYDGISTSDHFGYSFATGDFNNDTFTDIIIGAFKGNQSTGCIYIYNGDTNPDNVLDTEIKGYTYRNDYGKSLSSAGDLNGDGYEDFVVAAPNFNGFSGRTYIYFGNKEAKNKADLLIDGFKSDELGISVSGGGDINGDGFDDLVVGAYGSNSAKGNVLVYYGGEIMDNIADKVLSTTDNSWYSFASSVANAGDVNGDGFDDVLVGSFKYNSWTGRAYLFYGGEDMDEVADIEFTGEVASDNFGWCLSSAGDVNNDGFDDIVIGASNSKIGGVCKACLYLGNTNMDNIPDVIWGTTSSYFGCVITAAGDLNNDGFDDVAVGYGGSLPGTNIYFGGISIDNIADLTVNCNSSYSNYGSAAGRIDINNDGFDDLIVSERNQVSIYYGRTQLLSTPDLTITNDDITNNLIKIISSAGDTNGDGFDEILIGIPSYPNNGLVLLYSDNPQVSIKTIGIDQIKYNQASVTGSIYLLNTPLPSSHGFCYSTAEIPTIDDYTIELGSVSQTGVFASTISGLSPNTSYYICAYATNGVKTVYGNILNFTTPKAQQSITFNMLEEKTYGDSSFELNTSSSSGLPLSFNSSDINVATISGSEVFIKGTGITTITASQSGSDQFNPATDISQELNIKKATLTVVIDNQTKIYGSENPPFTFHYEGFVYNENEGIIESPAIVTSECDLNTGVGEYDLQGYNGNSLNYNFEYEKGFLTIEPAELTVKAQDLSITEGQIVDVFPYEISGFRNNDNISEVEGVPLFSVDYEGVEAGVSIPIIINTSTMLSENYIFKGVNGELTITTATKSKPILANEQIIITPNPLKGDILNIINLNNNKSVVEIYNLFGQPEFRQVLNSNNSFINLKNLKPATYVLKIIQGHSIYITKLIKK